MMRSLDSVTFDTTEFEPREGRDGVRVWHTPAGDGLGLFYFPTPPDIPAGIDSIAEIRAFYRRIALEAGSAIIEVNRLALDGCPAIRTINKVPQQPSGMTYIGSLTLPFRDFSYVVKVQCREVGVTGIREALVADELLQAGVVTIDESGQVQGWMQDPSDPAAKAPLGRNRADSEEYDARFPEHPLSRLRSVLKRVQETLRVTEELKQVPPFTGEKPSVPPKPWWKIY
jgi:hypothetical protein